MTDGSAKTQLLYRCYPDNLRMGYQEGCSNRNRPEAIENGWFT